MDAMTKEQWDAICACDRRYDGIFYYGLKTTRKVCRPSCPKRSYDPKRVVVFNSLQEARDRGYRPCSRCRPELPEWTGSRNALAEAAEDYLRAHYAESFSLSAVAEAMHVDQSYLARSFKSATGGTLLAFCNTVRCETAREMLARPELSISYIASAVGYVSASHFTQVYRRTMGCTPSAYRRAYFRSLADAAPVAGQEDNGE